MDNVFCHHILQTQCIWQFNVFRQLNMQNWLENQNELTYISPYFSCITCGSVQNTAVADAATSAVASDSFDI